MEELKERDDSIDIMKGIITVLMILGHVIQHFSADTALSYFSAYVNLTTFSAFMFTFGYVCQLAYLDKSNLVICQELFEKDF